jgi:hypothetical protein
VGSLGFAFPSQDKSILNGYDTRDLPQAVDVPAGLRRLMAMPSLWVCCFSRLIAKRLSHARLPAAKRHGLSIVQHRDAVDAKHRIEKLLEATSILE